MPTQMEMPKYKCHKTVWALKIKNVEGDKITPEDGRYSAFTVSSEFIEKHSPESGGYYVAYEDGYKSFSPGDVFEGGYTAV